MTDERASQRPAVPPCLTCKTNENVFCLQTPEFPHIHHYQCVKCGSYWTTSLDGKPVILPWRDKP
jgi:hypothetical protein